MLRFLCLSTATGSGIWFDYCFHCSLLDGQIVGILDKHDLLTKGDYTCN